MTKRTLISTLAVFGALLSITGCAAKPDATQQQGQSAQQQANLQKKLNDPNVPQAVKDQIRAQQTAQESQQSAKTQPHN
jgi:hypothetical protein